MKKLKFILCVGILGVMTYGGITAYNHVTMTEQERLLLANVEALTSGETGVTTVGYTNVIYTGNSLDYAYKLPKPCFKYGQCIGSGRSSNC